MSEFLRNLRDLKPMLTPTNLIAILLVGGLISAVFVFFIFFQIVIILKAGLALIVNPIKKFVCVG